MLKKALLAHLRQRRTYRRPKSAAGPSGRAYRRCRLDSRMPGHRRAEDRAVPGHWEGDLLVGSRHSYIADAGGAAFALRLPDPGHGERDADGRPGAHAARPATPYRADGHADVGSRVGTRGSSHVSRSRRVCRCTSATRGVRGSAARTRTPTACCDSTSPGVRTWPGYSQR